MRKDYLRPYKDDVLASSSSRIFAFLVDGVILIIVSFLLMMLSMSIIGGTSTYKNKQSSLKEAMIECYKIEEEAHIYQFVGEGEHKYDKPRDLDQIFEEYSLMHILYSYSIDSSAFTQRQVEIKNPKNLPLASYQTDQLAFFYDYYVTNYNNFNGVENDIVDIGTFTPRQYFYKAYKENAVNIEMWKFDEENYSLPYLDGQFAVDLYVYLFENEGYQAGLTRYNLLATNFKNLWNIQVNQLIESSRFEQYYDIYKENYASLAYMVDIGTFSAYLIAFCISYVLPQVFFKDMQTLGKKLFKIKVVDSKGYVSLPWQKVVRNILTFFMFYSTGIVSCFLSGGTNAGWMYPLFEIGGYGFSPFSFMIIATFGALISLIVLVANKRKKAIHDLISDTVVIDMNYHVDIAINVEEVTKEEKETTETTYFDSSSFNNTERKSLEKDED